MTTVVDTPTMQTQRVARMDSAGARWRCLSRADQVGLAGLALVLSAWFVLRMLFMVAWQPAFMGYSDSGAYLSMASGGELWATGFHPAGYPVFLIDVHALVPLLFVFAWLSLVIPPATHWWDARFAIPPLGPLAAASALGAWQCARLANRLKRANRTTP